MNKYLKRRLFVKKLLAIPIISLIDPSILLTSIIPYSERQSSFIDPIIVTAQVKTALDLIASFSGSKDTGMAALMRYQTAILQEVIAQLNNIQNSLLNIQNAISQIPLQVQQSLDVQFREELIAEIYAAVNRYITVVLIPSNTNPEIITNSAVIEEITDILNTADQKIAVLNNQKIGIGPEACLIAPLAMSLNVAARTNLNFPLSVIKSSLERYKIWFDDMLSNKPGSIYDIQQRAMTNHDSVISEFENNRLAKRLSFSNFKLKGTQTSETTPDPGVIFIGTKDLFFVKDWIDNYGATVIGGRFVRNVSGMVRGQYKLLGTISSYYDNLLGVNLIKYNRQEAISLMPLSLSLVQSPNPIINDGEYVYFHPVLYNHPNLTKEEMQNVINSSSAPAGLREDHLSRAKILEAIAKVNYERATISLCAQASIVGIKTRQRITEYLNSI